MHDQDDDSTENRNSRPSPAASHSVPDDTSAKTIVAPEVAPEPADARLNANLNKGKQTNTEPESPASHDSDEVSAGKDRATVTKSVPRRTEPTHQATATAAASTQQAPPARPTQSDGTASDTTASTNRPRPRRLPAAANAAARPESHSQEPTKNASATAQPKAVAGRPQSKQSAVQTKISEGAPQTAQPPGAVTPALAEESKAVPQPTEDGPTPPPKFTRPVRMPVELGDAHVDALVRYTGMLLHQGVFDEANAVLEMTFPLLSHYESIRALLAVSRFATGQYAAVLTLRSPDIETTTDYRGFWPLIENLSRVALGDTSQTQSAVERFIAESSVSSNGHAAGDIHVDRNGSITTESR